MYIYGSYRKIKTEVSRFLDHPVDSSIASHRQIEDHSNSTILGYMCKNVFLFFRSLLYRPNCIKVNPALNYPLHVYLLSTSLAYLHCVYEKNYNPAYVAITLANNVGF